MAAYYYYEKKVNLEFKMAVYYSKSAITLKCEMLEFKMAVYYSKSAIDLKCEMPAYFIYYYHVT